MACSGKISFTFGGAETIYKVLEAQEHHTYSQCKEEQTWATLVRLIPCNFPKLCEFENKRGTIETTSMLIVLDSLGTGFFLVLCLLCSVFPILTLLLDGCWLLILNLFSALSSAQVFKQMPSTASSGAHGDARSTPRMLYYGSFTQTVLLALVSFLLGELFQQSTK